MIIKNVSEFEQCVTGIPSYLPGEEKEESEIMGNLLLKNENFQEVKKKGK